MNKRFIIIFSLVVSGVLLQNSTANAITQNQINAEVQIVCPDAYGNWFSGSGTVIDPKGIILTNRHVVTDQKGEIIKACFVGFVTSISQEPDFGTKESPNVAEVKYYTTSDDTDAAILYLNNPTNKMFPYVDIWTTDSSILKFGDKVEVVGYPSIGGSTITYTSGDFSGYGSAVDGTQNYLKATTPLEHGNSGGAAYSVNGQFVGMPTMVVRGELNSLSYILTVNSIKQWLANNLGVNYQNAIQQNNSSPQVAPITLQGDVTPPAMFTGEKIIFHGNQSNKDINWTNLIEHDSDLTITWPTAIDESGVDGYFVYFGTNKNPDIAADGIFTRVKTYRKTLNIPGIYYFMVAARDNFGNISNVVVADYNYEVYPEWVSKDPMQYLLITNRPTYFYIFDYSKGVKGNLLKTIPFDSSRVQSVSVASNNVLVEWNGAERKDFITEQKARFDTGTSNNKKDECNQFLGDLNSGKYFFCIHQDFVSVTSNSVTKIGMQVGKPYNFEYDYYFTYDTHHNELGGFFHPFVLTTTKNVVYSKPPTSNTLTGQILLQVESHGEAWYVNPADGKRYYMKDGPTAYEMMRRFGLGITDANLAKLPQEGESRVYPTALNNLKGKILLQVQAHGEAWYVYPKTGIRYYMKDGDAAYSLMRYHSLGITNADLEKIPVGDF